VVHVKNRDQFEAAIALGPFDLILSDFALPDYDGLSALSLARDKHPNVPFILLSGTLGEDQAVESLKSGATDYILKQRLTRLVPAVRRALSEAEALLQRKQAEEKLHQSREMFRQITENVEDLIAVLDLQGRRLFSSPSYGRLLGGPHLLVGTDSFAEIHPADREGVQRIFGETVATGVGRRTEYRFVLPDGTVRFIESQGSVIRDPAGDVSSVLVVSRDVTARKRAETELEEAHRELMRFSRQAGMAEVATGVLHNVGNVLNSVNVASTCLADSLKKSKAASLSKVVALLREHEADLGSFFSTDPKGKQLPGYLAQLAEHLAGEQAAALKELAHLQKNIEHIKEIVTMQQSYARMSGVAEPLPVAVLVEDALRMNSGALVRHGIQVIKEFEDVPPVTVDKHKVLQILVNLIRNAKYACDESGRPDKRLWLRVTRGDDRVRIAVRDNGVGIPPENLTRIFAHGFTTRKDGHGFGLHSGALAAKEMDGSLSVQSEGVGRGATFTLELPFSIAGRNLTPATGTPQLAA
jgi:PAS domain S-box-containing protein